MQNLPVARGTVIGGGSFGTALGLVLCAKGAEVRVWVRDAKQADAVNAARENEKYLKDVKLPDNISFTSDCAKAVEGTEIILLAIPTQFLRRFLEGHRSTFPVGPPIVLCAKGVEVGTLASPYQIVHDELPGKYNRYMAVLAGPSFAKEIAAGLATNVTVAADDEALAEKVQHQMSCRKASFRCYRATDIIGCEIAGAVKNVLAIASGCATGLGLGNNARAGLICRGLAEMTQLAYALGSDGKAMPGLAGVGDLLLTCSSEMSRNFTVGFRLAKGESLDSILGSTTSVAEGVATAKSLHDLATKHQVEMPICEEVYKVLYEHKNVIQALKDLEDRPLAREHKGDAPQTPAGTAARPPQPPAQ